MAAKFKTDDLASLISDKQRVCKICSMELFFRRDNVLRHYALRHKNELESLKKEATIQVRTRITTREAYITNLCKITAKNNVSFTF